MIALHRTRRDASMTHWSTYSRWHEPRINADALAAYLDTTTDWIEHCLAEGKPYVPAPADRQFGHPRWTEHQVFTTILSRYPQLADRVPRLFPTTDDARPAQFRTAEPVDLGDGSFGARGTFVVHYWEPADGRGVVAIAYPTDYVDAVRVDEAAAALLDRIDASAVAVVCGMQERLPFEIGQYQPLIGVADHSTTVLSNGRWGWFNLPALLNTDIPWWPLGLTDYDAMLTWRPGDPIRRLQATDRGASAAWLTHAAHTAEDDTKQALATIASWIDYSICHANRLTPDGRDDMPERPGLIRAAIAEIPPYHTEYTAAEVALALHHLVEDPTTAYWAVRTGLMYDAWMPLAGFHVLVIDRDRLSRLGHEWCNRLTPVPTHRRNELGFSLLTSMMNGRDASPQQWWSDPLNPDTWAISDDNGTLFATIGTRVPARGHLCEVTVGHPLDKRPGEQLVFFRDSHDNTWPMPTTRISYYCSGSDDDHADRLASSLVTLADNAADDTSHCHDDAITDTELRHYIATTRPPFTLTRTDIERLR